MTPVYHMPNSADISEKKQVSHLILVDSEVRDADLLTTSLPAGYAVCPLAQGDDGIAHLQTLMNNAPESIHVLAHGRSGAVRLGGRWLQLDDFVSAWQNAAGTAGQVSLHFWSCMTGAGSAGKAFVQELSHKIGGVVTAFSGLVGAKVLGGSWVPDVCSSDASPVTAPFVARGSYAFTLTEETAESAIELRKLVMDGQIAIQVWLNPGVAIDTFDLEFAYNTDGGSYTGYESGISDWAMIGNEESAGTLLYAGYSSQVATIEGASDILLGTLYFTPVDGAQSFVIELTDNSSLDNSTRESDSTSVPLGDLPMLDFELGDSAVTFALIPDSQDNDDVLASFTISDQETGYLYGDEATGAIERLEVIETWTDEQDQQHSDRDTYVIEVAGDGVTFLARQIVQIEIGEWDSVNNRPVSLGVGDDDAQVAISWQDNTDGVVGTMSFTDNEDGENLSVTIELINSGNSTDIEPDIAVVYVSGVKQATYSLTGWTTEDGSNPSSLAVTAIESLDPEEVFSGILEYENGDDNLPTGVVVPNFGDEGDQDFRIDFDGSPAGSAEEGEQFFDFSYDDPELSNDYSYIVSVVDTEDGVVTALYDSDDDGVPDRFVDVANDNDSGTIEFAEDGTVTVTVTDGDSSNLTGRLAFSSDGAVVGMYLTEAEGSSDDTLDFNTTGTVDGAPQEGERYYVFADGEGDAAVLFEDATLRATLAADEDGDPTTYSVNWEWLDKDGNVTEDESGTWTFEDKDGQAGYESWTMVSSDDDGGALVADGDDEDTLPDGFYVKDDEGNQVAVDFTWQDRDEGGVVATFTSDEVLGNDGNPITFNGSLIDSDNNEDPDRISGTWDDDTFEGVFSVLDTNSDGIPDTYQVVFSNIRTGRVQLDSNGDPAGVYVNMDEEDIGDEGDQDFQIDFDGSPAGSAEEGELFFDFYYDAERQDEPGYVASVEDTEDGVVTELYDDNGDGVPDRFYDVEHDDDIGTIEFAEDGTVTVTVTQGDSSNLTGRLAFSSDGAMVGMYLTEAEGSSDNEAPTAVELENTTTTLEENTDTTDRIKVADIAVTDDALGTNDITLSGDDADSFEVEAGVLYLKSGVSLDHETQESYAVTVEVKDNTVTDSEAVTIDYTLSVSDVNEAPTGGISITGTPKQGETLTAVATALTDADGLGTLNYQWYAGDDAISGATASSYTL
ncbi:DUF4347 domain-containing protein, partial [Prosthecochloris vibrioformis]